MATTPRILYIANNHPQLSIGGAEVYTYDLYQGMKAAGEFEPIFLARTHAPGHNRRTGTPFYGLEEDPNQILWSVSDYDYLWMTSSRKEQYTLHFRELLETYRPDLVHIQHTFGIGIDLIRQIRRTLPAAPIVYTLHEFLPICHAEGHMLRTSGELCSRASPRRCHECFPGVSPRQFLLREQFIKSHLRLVDLFLCPSNFLLERYVSWGVPRERLRFLENGRKLPPGPRRENAEPPPIGRIGFFGQLTHDKGVLVLLDAIKLLVEEGNTDVRLEINGGNLEHQPESFRNQLASRLDICASSVSFRGRYQPSELAKRMRDVAWVVVPSIWWENSPLVIQEAFMHGRPVICSDIGGMAEKVTDGVNGLHFRVGDALSLAATLDRASRSPELWQRLRDGIPTIFPLTEAVDTHREIYRSLLRGSAVA